MGSCSFLSDVAPSAVEKKIEIEMSKMLCSLAATGCRGRLRHHQVTHRSRVCEHSETHKCYVDSEQSKTFDGVQPL